MQQRSSFLTITSFASALLLPAAPAQASEVVKLARLVITGKRLSNVEPARGDLAGGPLGPQAAQQGRLGSDEVLGAAEGPRHFRPI